MKYSPAVIALTVIMYAWGCYSPDLTAQSPGGKRSEDVAGEKMLRAAALHLSMDEASLNLLPDPGATAAIMTLPEQLRTSNWFAWTVCLALPEANASKAEAEASIILLRGYSSASAETDCAFEGYKPAGIGMEAEGGLSGLMRAFHVLGVKHDDSQRSALNPLLSSLTFCLNRPHLRERAVYFTDATADAELGPIPAEVHSARMTLENGAAQIRYFTTTTTGAATTKPDTWWRITVTVLPDYHTLVQREKLP